MELTTLDPCHPMSKALPFLRNRQEAEAGIFKKFSFPLFAYACGGNGGRSMALGGLGVGLAFVCCHLMIGALAGVETVWACFPSRINRRGSH
jgi:hypothetical protein